MSRCAVVDEASGLVVNVIVAESSDLPPAGTVLTPLASVEPCDPGWVKAEKLEVADVALGVVKGVWAEVPDTVVAKVKAKSTAAQGKL